MKPDLKRIREYCEKATPGPWDACRQDGDAGDIWFDIWSHEGKSVAHCSEMTNKQFRANANFIANAIEDLPALLDYCEALERVVEAANEVIRNEGQRYIDKLDEALAELDKE